MTGPNGHLERLDAYLDGVLTDEERMTFESELAVNPRLRAAFELQRRIDDSLDHAAAIPGDDRLQAIARDAIHASRAEERRPAWRRILAVAAALALLLTGTWLTWRGLAEPNASPRYTMDARQSLEAIYEQEVATGFMPEVVCRDDAEFQGWFRTQFGQPLSLSALPEGATALGLSYAHAFSPWTIDLLARVDGQPVLVFVDLVGSPEPPAGLSEHPLHHHRRTVGGLVLHEVSPFAEPRLLAAFADPTEDAR